ncbi:ArsA family ATPase [Halovenus salina]|uniref:ArsA family ATPase n=1 Tax=Halovenus salina TaxID=1510225 RepID=UPI002260AF88|nr:TRC40/GET3/ArsA family transport-energizing ATPase [Halovenus salina]
MEIDVEPVETVDDIDTETLPSSVDAAEYVLYGGKGGVGKTTMAAATALASASDGTETLVVSTDPAHSLSDTLETDVPQEPARIHDEVPLYGAEIDPEAALADSPLGMEGGNPLAGMLGEDVADPLAGSMPGADEAAAVRLLLEYLDDPRFDRVVVDTAPTGHTLRLLELPEMLDSMMGKLVTLRERMSGMFDMFGEEPDDEEIDSIEEFSARIERLRDLLRDPTLTDFRLVMVPEELSIMESERMLDRLDAFGVPVGTVVVNRVMQDPTEVADLDPEWFVAPNHTDCEFCAQRWEVQQQALARSQDIFRGHDVRRVPLLAEEVRGEKLLRVVAACLAE